MDSNQYSISLVVFFVSYVLFEVPSNLILSKTRPSVYLPIIMFLWGCVTCCMAAVTKYEHLVALRFIIGILEAGFAPGILLILSSWYKKNEQSRRYAVFISAAVLSGAFGGLIAGGITGSLNGAHGLAGWRWLFVRPHPSSVLLDATADMRRLWKVLLLPGGQSALISSYWTSPPLQRSSPSVKESLRSLAWRWITSRPGRKICRV